MKTNCVSDFLTNDLLLNQTVEVLGWLRGKRIHKNVIFLDVKDSTGCIQIVLDRKLVEVSCFNLASDLRIESAISVKGVLVKNQNAKIEKEIIGQELILIGGVSLDISPNPRDDFDIFSEEIADNFLKYRHIYIRNDKSMAILRFRNLVKGFLRQWFEENQFVEIDAPILVPAPLYEGKTAIALQLRGQNIFLSQCAGFYLESSVHAFERVFNMGPSFRGEESRSKRHLMEYWHIKAEYAWGDREHVMALVENIFAFLTRKLKENSAELMQIIGKELCLDGLKVPFPRLAYRDAVKILEEEGLDIQFGTSFGNEEEEILSRRYDSPFWIVGIPRSIEPFPYCIDQDDKELTMVADLIANNGYGELLGIAEKISDHGMLIERMSEKGKENDPIYGFVKDVHRVGCVPHVAFGMGLERLMRWLLNVPHVRDCIPFPRVVRRNIMP